MVEAPAEEPAEQAPATEDLPPMDVAEIPSDLSSIEMYDGAPVPTTRESQDEPAVAADRPRGLGYFGG